MIAVRERPLMLDCRVQGEEPIMVTWRKNGVPLPTSPRVRVLANGTLFIQSFQKRREGSDGDIGEYDCAAQNRYGMLVSRKAKVLLACECFTVQHSTTVTIFVLCNDMCFRRDITQRHEELMSLIILFPEKKNKLEQINKLQQQIVIISC